MFSSGPGIAADRFVPQDGHSCQLSRPSSRAAAARSALCLDVCVLDAAGSDRGRCGTAAAARSEEHTSELQSLMRTSYAVFCLKKKNITSDTPSHLTLLFHNHYTILYYHN